MNQESTLTRKSSQRTKTKRCDNDKKSLRKQRLFLLFKCTLRPMVWKWQNHGKLGCYFTRKIKVQKCMHFKPQILQWNFEEFVVDFKGYVGEPFAVFPRGE